VNPGDTVKTWSVDAGGTDSKGVHRTSGGNPLTGPFYIEGAVPGDALVVHFNRIRLNRDSAISGPLIVNNALDPDYVQNRKRVEGYNSDWKLDRNAGFASLQKPTDALKNYRVPLAPMLGCVGVAPPRGNQYRSGYLDSFGGNMDYNQLREGVTVYLPVYVIGAHLFVGDGHASQGAGELTGDALETSMDIEFTVDLDPSGAPPGPRMENADYLMASGIAGSLDDAFRGATTNLVRWVEKKYVLNAAEVSSVLATSIVYDVAEVVDPQVHVVAKVPKSVLTALKPVN
jgi:acetamidase/formamidase